MAVRCGAICTPPSEDAGPEGRRQGAILRQGLQFEIGNHTYRGTGIAAYLNSGGRLKNLAATANHTSTRTTQLYTRRANEISAHEIEGIRL